MSGTVQRKEKVSGTVVRIPRMWEENGEVNGTGSFKYPGASLFNSNQTPPDVAGTIILADGCP